MSRYHSYLNTAATVLLQYKGNEPFAANLKKFFSQQKKYGSKDRKQIGHLCYCFFRLGKSLPTIPMDERILIGLFLCAKETNEMLADLKPEWNEIVHLPINEKIAALPTIDSQLLTQLFPFEKELSEGINPVPLNESFLIQPDLFLRTRPGQQDKVKQKLLGAGYEEVVRSTEPGVGSLLAGQAGKNWMRMIGENCIALPNTSKIEAIIELDKEAVVQDYSSQRIAGFLELLKPQTTNHKRTIWDCCAGSGGKSILAKDVLGDIDLTVSDIRETILMNLRKRFQSAGITDYKSEVIDLSASNSELPILNSQLILCDVPCTGSGTWSRNPEQLYFFNPSMIEKYSLLQRKIVNNVLKQLRPDNYFLYITCSVFKKENEEMIDYIKEKFHLKLVKMELLKGYDQHADTLFAALFIA